MRYYYKDSKGNTCSLKSECIREGYTQITEEEYNSILQSRIHEPTAEQKATQDKARKIAEYKAYLEKTDYIVLKIAEAQSEGDTNKVTHLRTLYKSELEERKKMRDLLNR